MKGKNMEKWLECTVSVGQFTGEFAVQGKMFDSTVFSMFAPEEDLQFSKEKPTGNEHVEGTIRHTFGRKRRANVSCSPQTHI